jgi:hypothetical protein
MRRPEKAVSAFLDDRGLFEVSRVPQITKRSDAAFLRGGEYTPAVLILLLPKRKLFVTLEP